MVRLRSIWSSRTDRPPKLAIAARRCAGYNPPKPQIPPQQTMNTNAYKNKKWDDERQRLPTHPGEILSDIVLPGANLSVSEFAQMLGVSRHVLRGILAAERPVTPEIAVRLGKLLNTSTDVWLNMQISRDLWLARKSLRPEMRRLGAAGKRLARKAGTGQFQTAAHV